MPVIAHIEELRRLAPHPRSDQIKGCLAPLRASA